MTREDIDIYLNNIRITQSDNERMSLTKEFYEKIISYIVEIDKNRTLYFNNIDQDIMNYIVETGALSTLHEIAASEIPDLSRVVGVIVDSADVPNKESEKDKIEKHIDGLLQNPDILPENPTKKQATLYDGLLSRKVYSVIEENRPVDEITIKAVNRLFSNLPEGFNHRDTILYEKQLLRKIHDRDDVRDLIPRLPADEYRAKIDNPAGMNRYNFDNMINEFLAFYGNTGEISDNEKTSLFTRITSEYRAGRLMDSNTYQMYFMGKELNDNFTQLFGRQDVVIKDVLARIYENGGKDIRTTKTERELFERFFLPDENNEYNGIFRDVLTNLFSHSLHNDNNWLEITRYMIRLKKIFSLSDRPTDEFLGKVYDYVNSVDISEELKRNLDFKTIEEANPDENVDKVKLGWEYSDEDIEKWEEKTGSNPNITYSGLRKIDYADIALELMVENDPVKALDEFSDSVNMIKFRRYGKDIFNSRAIRKLTEKYIDTPAGYDSNAFAKEYIKEFVNKVTTSPDFNIFKEQEISELLQLGYLGKARFGVDMLNLVRANLAKNPTYQMTNEEAEKNISDFIASVGENTIDESKEADFDKFLISITKLRINSKEGIMPKEAVDFLINQSMRADSLINIKKDKYGKVPERAIEDLGKIDNLNRNNDGRLNRIYVVRDYLKHDSTVGLHSSYYGIITIKREQINNLSYGKLDAVDTIFHENTHMTQDFRLDRNLQNYKEYLMKKERLIRSKSQSGEKYYDENYFDIFIEIEAREVAARMTAEYAARIAPKTQIPNIADELKQSVVTSFLNKFKEQEDRFAGIANKEASAYIPAINKKDNDGETKNINQIFDRRFPKGNTVLNEFINSQPYAEFEYFPDGTKKTFSEQLKLLTQVSGENINYEFIRDIVNYSGTAESAKPVETILALSSLLESIRSDNSSKGKCVSDIVEKNLPGIISKYAKSIKEEIKTDGRIGKNSLVVYDHMKKILDKINTSPNADWVKGFETLDKNGNSSISLMTNYCDMIREFNPNVDDIINKYKAQEKVQEERRRYEKMKDEQEGKKRLEQLGKNDKKRIRIHRGNRSHQSYFKEIDKFRAKMQKMAFKNISEALKYAYDNPDSVDYHKMRDYIRLNRYTLAGKDFDLGLIKTSVELFLDNPKSDFDDINFINEVLYDNIGFVADNYLKGYRNNPNKTEFSVLKDYEAVRRLCDIYRQNPDLLNQLNANYLDQGSTGVEWLNALRNMIERTNPGIDKHYKDVLQYKYREDGTLQTFDEQMLNIVTSKDYMFNDKFLRRMINNSGSFVKDNNLEVLNDITRYRVMCIGVNIPLKFDFIRDVYKDNIPTLLDSYEQKLTSGQQLDEAQLLRDYYIASEFIDEYRNPKLDIMASDAHRLGLYTSSDDKKTPLERLQLIKSKLEKMPAVESKINYCKYKDDGTQRNLAEMIDFARENSENVSLPFMQTVIMDSDVAKDDNSLSALESLNKFIHVASEDREVDFINGVIKNCLPTCIDNYSKTFEDKNRKRTDDDLIAYQNIVTYLNTSKENRQDKDKRSEQQSEQENADGDKKTITERLEEIKAMMEERWPGIDVDSQKLDKKRNKRGLFGQTSVYDQLKKNKVSVEGKKKAAEIEARMAEKKQEIEYDG